MAVGKGSAIEAGEAFVFLGMDDKQFRDVLTKAKEKFMRFGASLRNIGLGVAGIGSTIIASLGTVAFATLKYIDSIQDIADRTNSSTEAVSRLAYAAKLSATSIEDVEAANKKLTMSAVNAVQGSEEQQAAFRKMGISAEDFLALDMDERFIRIAGALEELEEPLDKSRFLIALLGKSASTVTPLLGEGAEGLKKLFDEAESVGAVIRKEDGKKAAEAMDALDTTITSLKSTMVELGLAVFSLGEDTKEGQRIVLMYLKMAREWIKENKKVVAIVLIVGAVLVAVGSVLVVMGVILSAVVAGITALVTIASGLAAVLGSITVVGLAVAAAIAVMVVAIGYLIYHFFKFTKLGQNIAAVWIKGFNEISESFGIMWSGLIAALRKGDLQLAMDIVTVQIVLIWNQILVKLRETWFEFINFFVGGFNAAVMLLKIYFNRLASYIKVAGLEAIKFVIEESLKLLKNLEGWTDKVDAFLKSMRELSGNVQANLDAEVKAQIEIEKKVIDATDEKDKERQDKQTAQIKEQKDEVLRLIDLLKKLEKQANKPIVVEPVLPVAPMPREKGKPIDVKLGELGDSTRGLFDSADFRGALGIGGQNAYAKQAVDLQRDMLGELQKLNAKDGRNFD